MDCVFDDSGNSLSTILIDLLHPVGSFYISDNSTSPATLFGGTWERIQDKFLLAAGATYAAGTMGGEATHTLTIDEMPSHNHTYLKLTGTSSNKDTGTGTAWGEETRNTGNKGGSQPHNNMPPYLAVYVWKRTA